jgi:predicted Zn-dependent peptidase
MNKTKFTLQGKQVYSSRLCLFIGLLIAMSFVIPVYAKEDTKKTETNLVQTSITTNVIRKVFANGLVLLIKPNPGREIVSVNLLARMGPLYEPPERKGISSFMQRILFKGGTNTRNLTQINNELEALGATRNSESFSDYGNVALTVARSNLDKALDIYLDVIRNPIFLEWEVEDNKKEVIQEFISFTDQPFNRVSLEFNNRFYGDHPYSGFIGGSKETITKLTREDIIAWYKKIYIPNNMVITVVGDVDPKVIIEKFEECFGKLSKGRLPIVSSKLIPPLEKDLAALQIQNVQGAFMIIGYSAPSILSRDVPAMDIVSNILGGGGMGNRLFLELRDKQGIAYYVGSAYQPRVGPTAIIAAIVTAPQNFRIARDGIIKEFKRLINEPVPDEELRAAKKYAKGIFTMSQESGADQGERLALFELCGYGYQYVDRYPDLIDKVTAKDIQQMAKKYFDHYVLAVVAPEGLMDGLNESL